MGWTRPSGIFLVKGHRDLPADGHDYSPEMVMDMPRVRPWVSPRMAMSFPRGGGV